MNEFLKELSQFGKVECNLSLSKMTTLRIGGNADFTVFPDNTVSLDSLVRLIGQYGYSYKIIGKGSNLLCSDDDYHGVIIRLDEFNDFYFVNDQIVAQAGCSIISLSYEAMKQGKSGLEFASGIPGTVGGCTFMNAGAYKSSMSDVIDSVFVYRNGIFEWIKAEECEFSYRTSVFQKHPDWIVIAVKLNMTDKDVDEIRQLMDSRRERRMASQPLDKPSAGSVFRNPESVPAWKLIEEIGFRGKKVGGAQVSEKHVNFIINAGGATAADFLELVHEIQEQVRKQFDIELHMEVETFNWH